jgi:flavin-dependent dehydrogenase
MWGGEGVASSREYLIERSAFDAALLEDAAAAGLESEPAMVAAVEASGSLWRVRTRRRTIDCRAVIDARGRRARGAPLRGPRLVSVSQRFSTVQGGTLRTAIHPTADGWCWLADDGRGTRWVQVIGALSSVQANADVPLRIADSLGAIPEQAAFLESAVAVGVPMVRAAVAKMSLAAAAPAMLRIGDACIAMDPLSGHGIHEALVSARVAVATVHSYLESANWDSVAQVMNERTRETWEKMTTNAAHFYGMQASHLATGFWTQAASAYESLATAARIGAQADSRNELAVPFGVGG